MIPGGGGQSEDLVVGRAKRNRHGDPVFVAEFTVRQCVLAPAGSTEDTDTGDQVVSRFDVYIFGRADIRATDRIRRPGDAPAGRNGGAKAQWPWQVVGDPAPWRSPFTGWTPGQVVRIERVTG